MAERYFAECGRSSRWNLPPASSIVNSFRISKPQKRPTQDFFGVTPYHLRCFVRLRGTTTAYSLWNKPKLPCGPRFLITNWFERFTVPQRLPLQAMKFHFD